MQQPELDRIDTLEREGKLVVTRHFVTHYHGARLRLTNPATKAQVSFFPDSGVVIRSGVTQFRKGLDAALRLIGVRAVG